MIKSLNKFIIGFTFVSLLFFTFLAYTTYKQSSNTLKHSFESFLYKEVDELALLVRDQENRANQNLAYRLKILAYLLYDHPFVKSDKYQQLLVIDIYQGQEDVANINTWLFNNEPINNNIIKYFKIFADGDVAILQKFDKGFVVTETDFSPFIKTKGYVFFPNNSDLAYYINNKDYYIDDFDIFGKKYKIGVVPIYIDGEVEGALMIILSQWFTSDFQTYFQSKIYFKRGFPVLIDENGTLLLHPRLKGENIYNTNVFYKIYTHRSAEEVVKVEYRWPETITGDQKIIYYKYLPDLGYYIGITVFKTDLTAYTKKLRLIFIAAVLSSTALILILLSLLYFLFNRRLDNIRDRLQLLAKGIIPEKIPTEEILQYEIESTVNQIIDNYNEIASITESLSKEKYNIEIKPLSPQDVVRNNLLALKNNLLKAQEERKKHEEEEKIRAWRNIGVEKFINLLSLRGRELKDWAFEVLKTSVDYVDGFQGGFFLLEQDLDTGEKYFNLLTCYAFNEEKIVRRRFHASVGIFAKIYKDPKLLYIEKIPEDYLIITTALGEVKPKSLALVPLLFNNELIGVIEIDFIKKVEQYKLDFLNEIANHISSSLSSWRVEQETKKLIERYEKQAKQLKEKEQLLKEKIEQLQKLSHDLNELSTEYKSFKKLIDNFALHAELDDKGKILYVNQKIANLYKKSIDYFIGRNIREFSSFDLFDEQYKQKWQEILRGEVFKFTESIEIEDQKFWFNQYFIGVTLADGTLLKVIYIGIDITETKILERQLRSQIKEITQETRLLRREERKLRKEREQFEKLKQYYDFLFSLYDQISGFITVNPNRSITKVNKWFAEKLGYQTEELTNKYLSEIILLADKNKLESLWTQITAGEKAIEEFQFIRKDGNAIPLKANFFPKMEDNRLKEVYIILTD